MSSYIDLHLHSLYSDGRQTVREVFELAKSNGVSVVSLTDHDSTKSLAEAQQEASRLGLRLVPGVEITTMFESRILHILAYNFDPTNPALQAALGQLLESRKRGVIEKMAEAHKALLTVGKKGIDLEDFVMSQKGYFNRWKAADYLVGKQITGSREEALEYVKGVHVGSAEITTQSAIELIHNAGGIAVLAHPFGPKISLKVLRPESADQETIVRTLQSYGLDGLECYQPSHSREDVETALRIARELGLLITTGSDWHGPLALTGRGIKEYIPNYVDHPGALPVPPETQKALLRALGN